MTESPTPRTWTVHTDDAPRQFAAHAAALMAALEDIGRCGCPKCQQLAAIWCEAVQYAVLLLTPDEVIH